MQSFVETSHAFEEPHSEDGFHGTTNTTTTFERPEGSKAKELNFVRSPTSVVWHREVDTNQMMGAPTSSSDREQLSSVFTIPACTHPITEKIRTYLTRVSELRAFVAQEGSSLNRESEYDFWHFVLNELGIRKGNLVVTDDGNLRMVWKDNRETHLGLQFFGGGEIQYVIFKRRIATQAISRVAGRDTIEGVKSQIVSFSLGGLLNE